MPVPRLALIALIISITLAPLAALAQGIDHRLSQSPVKDQGARGTCVAFAINAAIETFPGVPTDLSEQMSYAAVKLHQNEVDQWLRSLNRPTILSEGDAFKTYVSLASILGTCHESLFPYDPNPRKLPADAPVAVKRFIELAHVDPEAFDALRMEMGKYRTPPESLTRLEGAEVRDIDRLKRELSDGRLAIPVIYQINGPAWSDLAEHANTDRAGRRDIIHPGMMHQFKPPDAAEPMPYNLARLEAAKRGVKFVDVVLTGEWLVRKAFDEAGYGGHAVTIVGYDDYGFIIKNSWGPRWATDGYARVSFDYHQLYATEAVLIDRVTIQPPQPSPLVKTRSIREARWQLKVHPGISRLDAAGRPSVAWMLSVWALEPREPDCEIVEYSIAIQPAPGQLTELLRRQVPAGAIETRQGMPMTIPDDVHARLADAAMVYVTVRFGDLPLGPDDLAAARFHAQHRYAFTPQQITGARDFAPVR